jgi:oligoendopeptidase F
LSGNLEEINLKFRALFTLAFFALIVACPVAFAVEADPAQGTVRDLSPLFRDDDAWNKELAAVEADLPAISQLRNSFTANATAFRTTLDRISAVKQRVYRLGEYSRLKVEEDGGLDANQARSQRMAALRQRYVEATAYLEPAVISLGKERVETFERADSGLSGYHRMLELILRRAPHLLGEEGERLLAAARPLQRQPSDIHDALFYADIPWPSIEIAQNTTRLGPQAYRATIFNVDRAIRRQAFESVTKVLGAYEHTAGAIAQAYMSGTAFEAKARHYDSSLDLAVGEDAMPASDFETLNAEADKALPDIERYLKLRKSILGLDELHVYDLRVPLSPNPHRYRLDEAESLILKALAPLGSDYVRQLEKNFKNHAMHAIAQSGKSPGASADFAGYRVQPFVLLTFDGSFDSVGSVAHEWGHAMHAQLFQLAQPFENAVNTSVFLFDTPSLVNEMLLSDYVIANAKSRHEKMVALDQAIDSLRYSYFGAISGIGLELKAHELADAGKPLTGHVLNEIYCGLQKQFNGVDAGVVTFDESSCFAWMNAPLYYDFYFYKYATAVSAAGFFVEALESRDTDARKRYFDLLRAGGSQDPDTLLKRAGFDAGSPDAYQPMLRRLHRLVSQLDATVAQPERSITDKIH